VRANEAVRYAIGTERENRNVAECQLLSLRRVIQHDAPR